MEEEVENENYRHPVALNLSPNKADWFLSIHQWRALPGTFICSGEINKSARSFLVKNRRLIADPDDHDQLQNDNWEIDAGTGDVITRTCKESWKRKWWKVVAGRAEPEIRSILHAGVYI